jgi:hypothetical protein
MTVEELAKAAYETFSTKMFGVKPEHHTLKKDSGTQPQLAPVTWEQLPRMAKEAWISVVERIRSA